MADNGWYFDSTSSGSAQALGVTCDFVCHTEPFVKLRTGSVEG